MNDCGSGRWMRTCEPSLASFTVSGSRTDVLVSDYSSKSKSSTGEGKARLFGVSNLSTYHCPPQSRWLGLQRASVRVRVARRTHRPVKIHTPVAEIGRDPDRMRQRFFGGRFVEFRANVQQQGGRAGYIWRAEGGSPARAKGAKRISRDYAFARSRHPNEILPTVRKGRQGIISCR